MQRHLPVKLYNSSGILAVGQASCLINSITTQLKSYLRKLPTGLEIWTLSVCLYVFDQRFFNGLGFFP
jgi:hypothetical protein